MNGTILVQGKSLMYQFLNELSGTEVAVQWRLRSATSVPGSQSGPEVARCTGPCTEHRLLSGFAWILGCLLTGCSIHLPWTCAGPVWPKCKRCWHANPQELSLARIVLQTSFWQVGIIKGRPCAFRQRAWQVGLASGGHIRWQVRIDDMFWHRLYE